MCTMLTNKYMPSLCIPHFFNVWIKASIQVNRIRFYHDGFISEKWPVIPISIGSCFCCVHEIPTNLQSDIANCFSVNINLSTFKLIALSCCVCLFCFFFLIFKLIFVVLILLRFQPSFIFWSAVTVLFILLFRPDKLYWFWFFFFRFQFQPKVLWFTVKIVPNCDSVGNKFFFWWHFSSKSRWIFMEFFSVAFYY